MLHKSTINVIIILQEKYREELLNMINNKNKTTAIVFGIFALVIVTTAASFAFFTYSRVGNTTTTITSGDIEFTYKEGEDASLANAFPVSDSVGANDTSEEYTFTVNLKSTSASNKMNYNVWLLDNNKETQGVSYFTNDQIKFALIKDGTYIAGTTENSGNLLSSLDGFNIGEHTGEGLVLQDQEIVPGKTDEYKLRIWISDDVNYSNTDRVDDNTDEFNDAQTSTGKYNGYKYSLKVKVTSEMASTITIENVDVNIKTITADLKDINGLTHYAITTNANSPENDSEWISVTDNAGENAKTNVTRTANSLITSKSISYTFTEYGYYYLHVKNNKNEIKTKKIDANLNINYGKATDAIIDLATRHTHELRVDEHEATGQQPFKATDYRYWGKNPDNYVWFNNELWRIIGVFDVEDSQGNVDKRLKIIRNSYIGSYSWDTSTYNDNLGINEWKQSDLKILLNDGDYYNRTNSLSSVGLTTESKDMILNAKWYLGAAVPFGTTNMTADLMYTYERGTLNGKQCSGGYFCNDNVPRTTLWSGMVGVIYPSDFGYSGNIDTCKTTNLIDYNLECYKTTWILPQWTLTPLASANDGAHGIYNVNGDYRVATAPAANSSIVYPAVYIKENINITSGTGTEKNPFVLSK